MSDMQIQLQVQRGNFDLEVNIQSNARVLGIFGISGAGKTTLIQAMAGLIGPCQGRICIGGQTLLDSKRGINLAIEKRRLGMVFQDALLFAHLSVADNLRYGQVRNNQDQPLLSFEATVQLLNLKTLLDRRPASLSGGERQRVAIGRALLAAPRLLLLDEALASLDQARKQEILNTLIQLRDVVKLPMLYISHVYEEIAQVADEIILLEAGRQLKTVRLL
ncbi:MAG: ATP-binding cassette domain-containing protein [Burkholderiaceae bacterium]|nr:ATP-binding cassette domain-containing protein [Burkholderiaceae bacterium]